jgi:hypothetical protein
MSTNTITSFSGLWMPTEYRNIEAGEVSVGTIQAGWLSARGSEDELASLHNLWGSLPPLPVNPSNKYANGKVSCATCHLADTYGRPTGTQKAPADEFYYLDPYSGGGSGTT